MDSLNDNSIHPAVIKCWENLDPKIIRFTDSLYPDQIRSLQIEASARILHDIPATSVDRFARDAVKATLASYALRHGENATTEEKDFFALILESMRQGMREDNKKLLNKER
jgi:hypothetical protein